MELLSDEGVFHELRSLSSDDDEWFVATAAREALEQMPSVALPILLARPAGREHSIVGVLFRLRAEERLSLDDATFEVLLGVLERAVPTMLATWRWERDFATRVRSGAFASTEAMWRARYAEHPDEHERGEAIHGLVEASSAPAALAEEMATLLTTTTSSTFIHHAGRAISSLPPVLSAPTVERLVAGLARGRGQAEYLLAGLARHGAPAAGLVPYCLALLTPRPGHMHGLASEWKWREASRALALLGDVAAPARPTLLDRLIDSAPPSGFHEHLLVALGDRAAVAEALEARLRDATAAGDVSAADAVRAALAALAPRS